MTRESPVSPALEARDPMVRAKDRPLSAFLAACGLLLGAAALFLFLNAHRLARAAAATPSLPKAVTVAPPPPPLNIPKPAVIAVAQPLPPPPPPSMPVVAEPPPRPPVEEDLTPRFRAPAVIVDLQHTTPAADMAAPPAGGTASAAVPAAAGRLDPNEQFAARLGGESGGSSVATQLTDLPATIVQGTTIHAVMETAINSDLPGFARAMVSRDVLAFDGRSVLIPRGSRVIGQYRNAISGGQSRVFIIWTRVIRPDGVAVEIGSPGGDKLGQGGLSGEVDSHFFARFGGAILLSVLNAGVAAVSRAPTTSIAIGSPAAAMDAAAGASVPRAGDIPPTIKVPQGVPVTIFLARDLDFSNVKRLP
jgi:type IV secretion system protein VirB10